MSGLRTFTVFGLCLGLLGLLPACERRDGRVEARVGIEQAYTIEKAEGFSVGAVYLVIHNRGRSEDRLVAAASPWVTTVELHESVSDGDMVRMVARPQGFAVPAHETVALEPGGRHIMLIGLQRPLVMGQWLPLTLQFEIAGQLDVNVAIRAR